MFKPDDSFGPWASYASRLLSSFTHQEKKFCLRWEMQRTFKPGGLSEMALPPLMVSTASTCPCLPLPRFASSRQNATKSLKQSRPALGRWHKAASVTGTTWQPAGLGWYLGRTWALGPQTQDGNPGVGNWFDPQVALGYCSYCASLCNHDLYRSYCHLTSNCSAPATPLYRISFHFHKGSKK